MLGTDIFVYLFIISDRRKMGGGKTLPKHLSGFIIYFKTPC